MNSPTRGLSAIGIIPAILAACSSAEVPASAVRAVGDTYVTANFQPSTATGPAVGGTVRLIDLPNTDDSQIQVAATGLPPGEHAWHIHTGTCAMLGGIALAFTTAGQNQGIDDPIVGAADGRGAEDAMIPAARMSRAQITGSPHAVQIHANLAPPGPGIACADLR